MSSAGSPRGGARAVRGPPARVVLTASLPPQGPRAGCERGPRCRCRPPRRAARSMPLSPAGSKHESPESPPPEPPPERQPRAAAGEPGAGLREETRLDPARGPGGPRSPKLAAPARMEEPAPGAIVVRIGIPDLQQTVSARPDPAPPQRPPRHRPANFAPPRGLGGGRPRARQDGSPLPRPPVPPPRCPGSPLPRSPLSPLPCSPQSPARARTERSGRTRRQRCLPGALRGPRRGRREGPVPPPGARTGPSAGDSGHSAGGSGSGSGSRTGRAGLRGRGADGSGGAGRRDRPGQGVRRRRAGWVCVGCTRVPVRAQRVSGPVCAGRGTVRCAGPRCRGQDGQVGPAGSRGVTRASWRVGCGVGQHVWHGGAEGGVGGVRQAQRTTVGQCWGSPGALGAWGE